ncbi:FCS-Like Zinc finger 10 [Cicer arietinum]|uniref:FCS-Like Zinc finger 10 n=1 Tax=Cicer arietinum TaxID=3827 RepID=A0A1S2YAL3_CICAR|nr:FCS-Like Zinc finger 10 [Cicer arietinum]XP_027190033.1 FCS-Like Zinc finger 10 [Cicer arietinum]
MLRKRSRSIQKDQHNMGHVTNTDGVNSDNYSQSHALGRNIKGNSIFNVPCLFVGLGPKGLLDSDSVRSPTSPLDTKVLSNLGNPVIRNQKSSLFEGNQRSWDCCKVGLGIVESLEDCDCSRICGKILQSPESKSISLSSQMMIKNLICQTCLDSFESSKSLPKEFCKVVPDTQNGSVIHNGESNVLFEIGETSLERDESFGRTRSFSLESCNPLKVNSGLSTSKTDSHIDDFAVKDVRFQDSSPPHFIGGSQNSNISPPSELKSNGVLICSSNEILKSLSASEIELSEDYTCVISHGPNPKTTHIFGDCILETHPDVFVKNHFKNEENEKEKEKEKENGVTLIGNNRLQIPNQYPSSAFLSFCHHCNKKLDEGKDIYIYRGEKAFCSLTCRAMEIMIDEEREKSNTHCDENSPKPKLGEQIFETGIPTTTT